LRNIECKAFVHAKYNAVFIELNSQNEELCYISLQSQSEKTTSVKYQNDVLELELPYNNSYALALCPIQGEMKRQNTLNGIQAQLRFGGTRGKMCFAIYTACKKDAPEISLNEQINKLITKTRSYRYEKLCNLHLEHWSRFWSQSSISYSNKHIEELWYMGIYALGASSKSKCSPPNLQGIWNMMDNPPWHADFHFNTNLQMSHWIACCSNHPELQEALIEKMTGEWHPKFKNYAQSVFAADGIAIPLCSDWFANAICWHELGLEMSLTAWMAQHLIEQWEFTQDKQLLKDTIFPFLLEVCAFYESILHRREDGSFNIELSHSPEQIWHNETDEPYLVLGSNPTIDLVFMRILFKAVLKTAKLLNYCGNELDRWDDILHNLPENPTLNGVLIDQETGFFHDGDRPGFFPHSHRHPSRLVGIYPGHEIGLNSSAEKLKLGVDSFNEFHSYGNSGFTGWSLSWQAAIAARLGLADEAESSLRELKRNFTLPGMLNSHNNLHEKSFVLNEQLFQIEGTIGAAAAVNEMLVQMHDSKIFLFAGVPKGKSASFNKLRLKGNILISSERKGQFITHIELISQSIDLQVRISNPWRQGFVLEADAKRIFCKYTSDIVLKLHPKIVYRLRPQPVKAVKNLSIPKKSTVEI